LGLGMRLIGTVPNTRKAKRYGTQGPKKELAQQMLTESIDSARAMLLHLARSQNLRTVMVTSATSGEGKTSLSCHLAASLARAGKRTLLVDADIRNPSIHKLFGLANPQGFSEVLCSNAELSGCIQATPVKGLSVLPAGNWSELVPVALTEGLASGLFQHLG